MRLVLGRDLGEQLVREKLALPYRPGAEAKRRVSPTGALVRKQRRTPRRNRCSAFTVASIAAPRLALVLGVTFAIL